MNVRAGATVGFVKLQRGSATDQLVRDPLAMHLLTVIALRARFTNEPSIDGLTFGQAQIGDWKACGMTEKQYRCAKSRLSRYGLATFKGTPDGTIATLTDSRVFSLRDERISLKQGDHKGGQSSEVESPNRADRGANEGRARGGLGATNQNAQNGQNDISAGKKHPSIWNLQQKAEAIRTRMRDLSEGHQGQRYVGILPGRTSAFEWTDEGRAEYDQLKRRLKDLEAEMTT